MDRFLNNWACFIDPSPLKRNWMPKNVKKSVVNEEIYWDKYSQKYSLVDQFNQISFCLWVNGVIFRNFYVCLSQRWEILPRKYLFINFFFFRTIKRILHNLYCESFYETIKCWIIMLCAFKVDNKDINQYRGSHRGVFCKNSGLRNFTKFPGKHLCKSLFFDKVACWDPQLQ